MLAAKTLMEDWQGGASKKIPGDGRRERRRGRGVRARRHGKKKPFVLPDLVCHGCGKKFHYISNYPSMPAAEKATIVAAN